MRPTCLISKKEKYIVMIDKILNCINENTGMHCALHSVVKSGDGLRKHYRVVMEDGREYLCKFIQMSEERLSVYQQISNMNIVGFQKTCFMWQFQGDIYLLLCEWNKGNLVKECFSNESSNLIEIVRRAARTIRDIHDDYITQGKTNISLQDIDKLFYKNMDLIDDKLLTIIKSYVATNYQYLNGRNKTIIHGDLHLHNILETNKGIVLIDIDDCSFGDPYMDLIYASNIIKSANEQILYYEFLMAYFENKIPEEFWIIVNFYSIYKAFNIMRCEKALTSDNKPIYSLESFVKQHKMMTSHIPIWFEKMEQVSK